MGRRLEVTSGNSEPFCLRCDLDLHRCGGCGDPVDCGTIACDDCEEQIEQMNNEGAIG